MTEAPAAKIEIDPRCEGQIPAPVLLAAERYARPELLCVLFLPFSPTAHGANQTRGMHYGQRAKDDEAAKGAALWAYRAAGDPRLTEPVTVEVVACLGRSADDDNVISALKPARDTLCRRGLLKDDSPAWWKYGGAEIIVNQRLFRAPWVILLVYRREEK